MSMDLPLDLTAEILSRLPATSVLRFKSVCRSWHALIETPNFVEKHRKSNPNITTILVATSRRMYLKVESFYKPVDFDFPVLRRNRTRLKVKGICSGLVFASLSFHDSDLVICNPTTHEFRLPPSPPVLTTESDLVFSGFSSFSNEYKLVRVIYSVSETQEIIIKADVYVVSTDSWVEMDVKIGCANTSERLSWYCLCYNPIILNGVFYWRASSSTNRRVLSFNTSLGVYDEISIPVNIIISDEDDWLLIEFGEEVSFIIYDGERTFDLWVLNENKSSWTWKMRIEDIPIIAGPLESLFGAIEVVGYTRSGELLVAVYKSNNREVLLYNLNSRETKFLPWFDVMEATNFYFYSESLLSIKLRNEVAESD